MSGPTCGRCGKVLLALCRFMGLATALGLWGVGVEAVYFNHDLGFYLAPLAVIISFLETVFLLNYCVEVCVSPRSICARVWDGVLWLDDWRKGLVYVLTAIPCFLCPNTVPLAMACGAMLAATGLLYSLKTYKTRKEADDKKFLCKTTYDRFDEEVEDLEESISNPTNNPTIMSVADQIEILEV
ncbi:transmembrane protein 72-like [Littorina saxatilis]|uniref:Uncharacterized protein n=1 Tax=Littorina saxatilis TaxID=31220 RepID=A0AAN9GM87_9CAEN